MSQLPTHDAMLRRFAAVAGWAAAFILTVGVSASIFLHGNNDGEPYSIFNHFISELGWQERSQSAALFNGCVSVGSLLIIPLIIVLARETSGVLRIVIVALGLTTALAGCTVGFVPLDYLKPHIGAAFLFFAGWLATVTVVTLMRWRIRILCDSSLLFWAGCAAMVTAAFFLAIPKQDAYHAMKYIEQFDRPGFWLVAFSEWVVFFFVIVWTVLGALRLWQSARREPSHTSQADANSSELNSSASRQPALPEA